jgi:hypothetical protein
MNTSFLLLLLCQILIFPLSTINGTTIKMDSRSILINNTRQLILSGSVHYARVLPTDWERVFLLAKELHLNTIQTYFMWNFHEMTRGNVTWKDRRDLVGFIQLAKKHNLYINLRIGPYVCGEYYYGGLPLWLRSIDGIQCYRCSDNIWKSEMKRVVGYVVNKIRPLLAQNGGNVILLQVENEYHGDQSYLDWSVSMANNFTLQENAYWSLCHDHTACANTNQAGHRAICTINGFWMDEYEKNPSQPSPKWMTDQQHINPNQPLIWTEDQGWFDQWKVGKRVRTSKDQMYGIARFIAYGGTWHNHYMLTGGSNFGLQAGGEVVTSYAPDAVIDSFLLRHGSRFTLYSTFYQVLSSPSVSQALLTTLEVPKAIIIASNATRRNDTTIVKLESCTDTDPAHIGQLDPSQEWNWKTVDESGYYQIQNVATGLCLDSAGGILPSTLYDCNHTIDIKDTNKNNVSDRLLWNLTVDSQIKSKDAITKCLSPKMKKGATCHRCMDANQKNQLGVWDCKNSATSSQLSNQWFHVSNNNVGIRSNRSNLCITAVSSSTSRVEIHEYNDGLSFLSNTDSSNWLAVKPFADRSNDSSDDSSSNNDTNQDWEIVLSPASVVILNQSTVPPTVLFNTGAPNLAKPSSSFKQFFTPVTKTDKTAGGWEYYLEKPSVGARTMTSSSNGPLEQLNLTNNIVDHMWYSTFIPKDETIVDKSLLNIQGRDGTELSSIVIINNTIHVLSSAMGLKNGGETPHDGKGISLENGGPTYNHHSLMNQSWISTWMIPGEHLQIFDPSTTHLVHWESTSKNNNVSKSSAIWFRGMLNTPLTTINTHQLDPIVSSSPPQIAYALNLTCMWKGTAYVNGFLLGRYWMVGGTCKGECAPPIKDGHCYMHWKDCGKPTQTLYHIPTSILKNDGTKNLVVLFEEVDVPPIGAPNQNERDVNSVDIVMLTGHP